MNDKSKNLTLHGMSVPHVMLILTSLAMIGVSVYLLAHYFQTFFPEGLTGGSLCNIQGFFSCDSVAYSPISRIFTIPISLFGILSGSFLVWSSIFPSKKLEETNHILTRINFAGCLTLFLYSIIFLGKLCPFCTLYYVFSGLACYLFYKYSDLKKINIKPIAIYAVITIISSSVIGYVINQKELKQDRMKGPLIEQFFSLPNLGTPQSDYRNVSSTKKFSDAPVRISVFSDFECPFCSKLAESMKRVAVKYEGKINIQFISYPLDQECNSNVKRPFHAFACKASYIAACAKSNFNEVHDELFENVSNFSEAWLKKYAKEIGVLECMNSIDTKEKVVKMINMADQFNIQSTPIMLINGVKIEGVKPLKVYYMIIDEIIRRYDDKK